MLNTSPAALVDELLAEDGVNTRGSWYEQVALDELQAYYLAVRAHLTDRLEATEPAGPLPDDVRDLAPAQRRWLRAGLAAHPEQRTGVDATYAELCAAVSVETARRWQRRLTAASPARRTQMLFRLLRIAGGPYWVLGAQRATPLRLAVTDTRSWREDHALRSFEVRAARVGQPQVDWRAVIDGPDGRRAVEGSCELRWSHGKLSGNPECKVQVRTALAGIPGYTPFAPS